MTQRSPPSPPSNNPPSATTPLSVTSAVHAALAQTPHGFVQQQLQAQIQTVMQMQAHGPFPSPAAIKEYEKILPGTFERIVRMAEKAQNDQAETVHFAQESLRRDTRRVHWMALIVSMLAMVGAGFCAWIHQPWVAGCFLGVPVFAVAKAFIDSLKAPDANQQAQLQRQVQQQQMEQLQTLLQQMAPKGKGDGGSPT